MRRFKSICDLCFYWCFYDKIWVFFTIMLNIWAFVSKHMLQDAKWYDSTLPFNVSSWMTWTFSSTTELYIALYIQSFRYEQSEIRSVQAGKPGNLRCFKVSLNIFKLHLKILWYIMFDYNNSGYTKSSNNHKILIKVILSFQQKVIKALV